jgi:alkanesulfonate monooxygenase SsuD/methylene tetrahydromethanopterin reductase-like flavin-dependent oxidoreductase (luciferase family)
MTDGDRLRIGLVLPTWPRHGAGHASWPEIRQLARDAEALGVDTIWVPDHLQRRVRDRPPFGFRECWTILTAAAEATTTIEVGPFVACTGFRNPGLLARMASTLDEVSGGRLVLGLGPGNPATDETWHAFGFDAARPVSRFGQSVEVIARLLREPPVTVHGDLVTVDGADVLPRGPRASIPLLLAASGRRTLDIAARWADAVNVNTPLASVEDAAAIVDRVADACERAARDADTLGVTGWARLSLREDGTAAARPGWIAGAPDEAALTLHGIRAAGVSHLSLYLGNADDPSPNPALTAPALERFVPFLEALRA